MDASGSRTTTHNETEGAMPETTKRTKKSALQRYNERHAALDASIGPSDPLRAILDGIGGLTERERGFILALRSLEATWNQPPTIPAELLEHGTMSVADAAKVLGVTVEHIIAANKHGFGEWNGSSMRRGDGETMPKPRKGKLPISEVLREFMRLHACRVDALVTAVAERLNTRSEPAYKGHKGISTGIFWTAAAPGSRRSFMPPSWDFNGYERVAERLGCSKAEAKRLMMRGDLFCWASERGAHVCTDEELEAYARKLKRQAAPGKAVAA